MLEYLINLGASVNHANTFILCLACSINDIHLVDYLLGYDIPEDYLLKAIESTLIYSMQCSTPFCIKMEQSTESNKSFDYFKYNENMLNIIDKILVKGFDVKKYSSNLLNTISPKNVEIVKYFINNGLVLENSAIDKAASFYNTSLIEFYLEYGLTFSAKTLEKILGTMNTTMLQLFVKHKIDLSILNESCEKFQLIYDLNSLGLEFSTMVHILTKTNQGRPTYYVQHP